MNRRSFLRTSTAATTAVAFPTIIPATVLAAPGRRLGANDRIQVGVIGLGGRARGFIKEEGLPGADLVAMADCFVPRCHEAAKLLPIAAKARIYSSHAALLEKEKLDAVFVETTTHARVLIAMHALQAGLDVYCEKPMSLTISEGRALVNAVKATGRVLQVGSQQRSMPINQYASKLVREGAIGRVKEVIAFNFWPPIDWQPRAAKPIPAGLDWDQWCNQTELRPYHPALHYGWANYVEYDGGGMSWGVSGWGTHSLDQVQCALGTDDTGPVELTPELTAGEPNPICRVTMRYANGTLLKLAGPKRGFEDLGAVFVGEHGTIDIRRGSAVATPKDLLTGAPPDSPSVRPGETIMHLRNFFDCMRSRQKPNADVETGHRATTVCHLVNIVRAVGRKLYWDPKAEKFVGDDDANDYLSRPRRKGYELPKIG
jgi:predicted dehydrogenase